MSLPQLNNETNEWKELTLPSGKKMSVRKWRVKEKKDLLFAVDGVEDEISLERELEKFIMSCTNNPAAYKDLSETDLIYLGVELRRISKGDEMEISYTCPHCNGDFDTKIDISKIVDVKRFNTEPLQINDNLTINFKELPAPTKKKLDEELANGKKVSKYNYQYLLHSVDSVMYNDQLYDIFTIDELDVFFDTMDDVDFEKLFTELQSRIGYLTISATVKCMNPQCDKDVNISFNGLTSFFAL